MQLPSVTKRYAKRRAETAVAMGIVGIIWSCVIACFSMSGRVGAFIDVLFRKNLDYAGNIRWNFLRVAQPFVLKAIFVRWGIAPAALIGGWLICLMWRKMWPRFSGGWMILMFAAIGAWLTIASPGRFFPHYYQLAMPIVCLAVGGAASGLLDPKFGINRDMAIGMIGLMFAISIVREGAYYLLPVEEWTRRKNVGAFAEQYAMADRLKAMLEADERFWNFGSDTALYFGTGQSPICGVDVSGSVAVSWDGGEVLGASAGVAAGTSAGVDCDFARALLHGRL